jgi:hypothetical protein
MNRIIGRALFAEALIVSGRTATAQSKCQDAKGTLLELFTGGNSATGTLKNRGWINGTTLSVFNSANFPTPAPTQITFSSTFVLTTGRGELKGTRVYLFDFVALKAVTMTLIDPAASTGIFAGATGVLYMTAVMISPGPPPVTFEEEVGGQICLAQQ